MKTLAHACVFSALIVGYAQGQVGFIGYSQGSGEPGVPDPEIAVGPEHILLATNAKFALYEKDGDLVSGWPIAIGTFFALGTPLILDPEVHYDAVPTSSGDRRWWAIAIDTPSTGGTEKAAWLLAVSASDDPDGAWYEQKINCAELPNSTVSDWWHLDSPNLTLDADYVYLNAIARNYDLNPPGEFIEYVNVTYIFSKRELMDDDPQPNGFPKKLFNPSLQSPASPPQAVDGVCVAFSFPPDPCVYLVEPEYATGTTHDTLTLHFIDPSGPTLSDPVTIEVSEYRSPVDVPQYGTSDVLRTVDARMWSAVYRNGSIWCTHHITTPGDTDRTICRWYQIDLDGWGPGDPNAEPFLAQQGDIDFGGDIHTFFPSIGVAANENVAVTFARSSEEEYPSIRAWCRQYWQDPGDLPTTYLLKSSSEAWQGGGDVQAYGDYSGTDPDPEDDCTFYGAHEWIDGGSDPVRWSTWIGGPINPCTSFGPESGPSGGARPDPDCDRDGDVDVFDFVCFQDRFAAGSRSADVNRDGVLDVLDFAGFVDAVTTSRR